MTTVAVLGRGVLGAATAYHLTKLGARVVCVDGGPLGGSATARSAGLVLHASSPAKAACTVQTLADIAQLDAEQAALGTAGEGPVGFVKTGMVRVASTPAELDRLRREMEMVSGGAYSAVHWLHTASQVSAAVPWLTLPQGATACVVEMDGMVDPVVLAGRYWRAARQAGAVHVPHDAVALLHTAVTPAPTALATAAPASPAFLATPTTPTPPQLQPPTETTPQQPHQTIHHHQQNGGRKVVGVVLADSGEEIPCDYCIDATGSWAGSLAEAAFGTAPLPMAATRSHYWTAKAPPQYFPTSSAMVLIPAARWYSRPTHTAGEAIVGLQEEISPTWSRAELESPAQMHSSSSGGGSSASVHGPAGDCWSAGCAVLPSMSGGREAAHDAAAADSAQAAELFLGGLDMLAPYVVPELLESLTLPHYTAGLTTYTPDGGYLIGKLPCPAAPDGYSILSGCNGSGLSSAGGLGLLAAKEALHSLAAQCSAGAGAGAGAGADADAGHADAGADPYDLSTSYAKALEGWSIGRPTVQLKFCSSGSGDVGAGGPAVGTAAYRKICSMARAGKFGAAALSERERG